LSETTAYRVLARKYRPRTFADLIGQDAMVRTLKNAFAANRIAQAFIMTGIRGTGKTTTARIVAKGMNCVGTDGKGGPSADPCGECEHCLAITEGRHVDVMEMDAASRTGVNDIREIIDSVHYRAASARYKIYIVDEVHMLSVSAFNALLKTLEEPPAHVKFIFATTEIRKVPVTVLSRCQRFDLRRIEPEKMIEHLTGMAKAEGAEIDAGALGLIARAAEGSVRDAVSLLDQAISHGAAKTTADQVRTMLRLADRGRVMDLFDLIMKGDVAGALAELSGQYADGADPEAVLRDLAELTHWISVAGISPGASDDPTISPDERKRGQELAGVLPISLLTRVWQMLLKALEEVAIAPNAMMAAEMAVIRLTHVADMPPPEQLLRKLRDTPAPSAAGPGRADAAPAGSAPTGLQSRISAGPPVRAVVQASDTDIASYTHFGDVVELIRAKRDMKLLIGVETSLRLVSYSPGRIEFQPTEDSSSDLAQRLDRCLKEWTGVQWVVSVVAEGGGATIAETREAGEEALKVQVREHPMVKAVFDAFPGAKITGVGSRKESPGSDGRVRSSGGGVVADRNSGSVVPHAKEQ